MATLFVVATPIGNLADISHRGLAVLRAAPVIVCEDTRKTRILLDRYGIQPRRRMLAYHEHNEERAGRRILQRLAAGEDVALCSNAGYPGISDPGYRIISAAIEEDFRVEVIPGASAIEAALLSSGLPSSSFTFKGFAPRRAGPRRTFLAMERELPHSLIFYESPHRVASLLRIAAEVLGDRRAAVCIELTKKYEAVHRGYLAQLADEFAGRKIRGEVTVVIAGNHPKLLRPAGG
jgi:16S rRNA (cytidine1402-2'-O)-methyltransferase